MNATNTNNQSNRSGKRKKNNQKKSGGKSNSGSKESFKGECEDLKGKVYFIGSAKQADNYNNTTEAILEYFLRNYTHGLDLVETLEALKERDFTAEIPVKATVESDASEEEKDAIKEVHKEEMKQFIQRKGMLKTNLVKAYGIILGQCTKALRAKLEQRKDWEDDDRGKRVKYNTINLLKAIREITHNYQDNKYPMESIYYSIKNVFTMKQEDNEGLNEFTKRFNNAVDIMETQHGKLALLEYLKTRDDFKNAQTGEDKNVIHQKQYQRFVAFAYLKSLNVSKSGKLVEDLGNQYALGTDQFPVTVTKATEAVVAYKNRVNSQQSNGGNRNRGNNGSSSGSNQSSGATRPSGESSFGQSSGNGKDNKWKEKITCYNCGKKGHLASECPSKNDDQTSNVQSAEKEKKISFQASSFAADIGSAGVQRAFSQDSGAGEMKKWILLDTGSSTDIFCDKNLLEDVQKKQSGLTLHTNGGVLKSDEAGELENYGEVWHDKRALTNILSFFQLQSKYHVQFDNKKDNVFHVFLPNGKEIRFGPSANGIYRYDNSNKDFCFGTVAENESHFTKRQIERAQAARKLYHAIGAPSAKDFRVLVRSNMIKNCPVTIEDIRIAEQVYGKDISVLKGKSVRTKPNPVVADVVKIPKAMKKELKHVELCVDVMYIQGLTFLTTISKKICYRTIEYVVDRSEDSLMSALDNVFRIYNLNGFVISKMFADPEFVELKPTLADIDIELNCCSAQEHVPEIERSIRVIKERFRTMYHRLPFKAIPKVMIKVGAMECVKWLNAFPPRAGVSEFFSPRMIVTGRPLEFEKHCKTAFGSYVQALHETNPTNTTAPRTLGCIYLRCIGHDNSGYELLNLSTRAVIIRRKFTEIPTPQNVIE